MSTLDISGGGNPNIEQAELFMSVVWALLTAYPKQFSVLIPVFYAMREQFLLEEITWLPPINDKPETFSEYGMTSDPTNPIFHHFRPKNGSETAEKRLKQRLRDTPGASRGVILGDHKILPPPCVPDPKTYQTL
jgi:hypothetical protein